MSRITWDDAGKRYYETGVDHAVLYIEDPEGYNGYGDGIPWNGLISVTETPSGGEPTPIYADNGKYLTLYSAEDFAASLECYTMPEEFEECDGSAAMVDGNTSIPGIKVGMQNRKKFALCYRTLVGNDVNAADASDNNADYQLHFIWGCIATPSEKAYNTVNDSPEAMTFSYELSTTPIPVDGMKPTAHIIVDTRYLDPRRKPDHLSSLASMIYGNNNYNARMVTPENIKSILTF